MGVKKYLLCQKHFDLEPGSILYEYCGYDYGHCDTEYRFTGVRHMAMTEDNDRKHFYVIPEDYLIEVVPTEEISEEEYYARGYGGWEECSRSMAF